MTSDRWLTRLVGLTVCGSAMAVVLSVVIAGFRDATVPDLVGQLALLLLGGLLGALTTRLTGAEPLLVTTAPGDAVAVTDDRGATDVITALVVVFLVIVVLIVLGIL